MATILKKNLNGSKGILSFTHKENKKLDNPITHFFLKNSLLEIKKNYFLSMHWGWFHENHKDVPYIDFHLAGKGTLSFKNKSNNKILDFCNRNFIDKIFKKKELNKIYDIICITRPVKFKNIDKIFLAAKKLYEKKKFIKFLIIFPIVSIKSLKNKKEFYNNLFDDYEKIFTEEEKKYINLMPLYFEKQFPLSKEEICNFMNLSKIFLLPVEKEGASRVIHEALLCGLPVITCKNLKGGGLDYLNEKNSLLIEDLNNMDVTILNLHSNLKNYDFDANILRKELSEEYQIDQFKIELENFYNKKKEKWIDNCNFDNLDRKLDSHLFTLNRKWVGPSNDLNSILSLYFFLNSILNKRNNFIIIVCIYILEIIFNFLKKIKNYLKR
jgi:glycosyltransferase involved in cell wall biosynthesis